MHNRRSTIVRQPSEDCFQMPDSCQIAVKWISYVYENVKWLPNDSCQTDVSYVNGCWSLYSSNISAAICWQPELLKIHKQLSKEIYEISVLITQIRYADAEVEISLVTLTCHVVKQLQLINCKYSISSTNTQRHI